MNYRKLGSTPLSVSEIGLGTAQLSNTDNNFRGVKFVPIKEARKILSFAIERGVNFFDTGINYGNAESLLKEVKHEHKDRIIVATKVGLGGDGIRDFSVSSLRNQIESSLTKIDVDCIDILQLNKPAVKDLEDGQLFKLLENLKKEGKIRYAGVVVGTTNTGYQFIKSGVVDCLQIMYNLLYQETEGLIEQANQAGLGVIIRSPLNNGLLSGTYTPQQNFDANDERAEYFSGPLFAQRLARLKNIQESLGVPNKSLLRFSIRFILSNKNISSVIPGFSKVSQIEQCLNIEENWLPFKPDELLRIQSTVSSHMKGCDFIFQN